MHCAMRRLCPPPSQSKAHLRRGIIGAQRPVGVRPPVVHPAVASIPRRRAVAVRQGIQVAAARVVRRRAVAVQHGRQGGVLWRVAAIAAGLQPLQAGAVLLHRILKPLRLEGGVARRLGGLRAAPRRLALRPLLGRGVGQAQALQLGLERRRGRQAPQSAV